MLNENQRRGLSISLRIVEENMQDIEQILNSGSYTGTLYDLRYNISSEIKEEILRRISLIRERIKIISDRFALEKEYKEVTKKIFGKFFSCWETVEGVKAKRLKGYGAVSDELYHVLDPQLNIIADLIKELFP